MTGKREPYRGNLERAEGRAKLEEWIESLRLPKNCHEYVCLTCGKEIISVLMNSYLGFADWSGAVICTECKTEMTRKEE